MKIGNLETKKTTYFLPLLLVFQIDHLECCVLGKVQGLSIQKWLVPRLFPLTTRKHIAF